MEMPWPVVVFFIVVLILKFVDKLADRFFEDE